MKGVLFVLVLVVAAAVGLGFYLGWFRMAWDRIAHTDHVTVTVDEKKFQEDKKKAEEKVHDLEHPGTDKTEAPAPPPQK
jgi:hypothetical protein